MKSLIRTLTDRFHGSIHRHRNWFLVVGALLVFGLGFAVNAWMGGTGKPRETEARPSPNQNGPNEDQHQHGAAHGVDRLASLRQLTVSAQARELMDIQTSPVERRYVTATVRMVGKVTYDETRLKHITAWVPGRLDRLFVDFTGVEVNKDDHMVSIYSPELYAAQQELIQAARSAEQRKGETGRLRGINLLESAREKLRLWGLNEKQIREIENREKPSDHLTIYAPIGGTVIRKLRQEGDYVETGERIYTVADLSQVWVMLDAYESDLVWLRYGQKVTFTTEAYPGETFTGRISFIQPVLSEETRTVNVRVNVPNPRGKLKPEMFVHGEVTAEVATGGRVIDPSLAGEWICRMHPNVIEDEKGQCPICEMDLVRAETFGYFAPAPDEAGRPLVIPASAVLPTGTRAVVYVEVPDTPQPTYEGREVVLGPRAGDYYLVKHGLHEDELVVTHGNFRIDSAVQIQAKPSMMTPEGGGGGGMHRHGGDGGPKTPTKTTAPMTIPPAFQEQMKRLDLAYRAISEALEAEDLARFRIAFGMFGKTLDDVDAGLLEGHARMLWKEFHMLLSNDVAEGREAKQEKQARRVHGLLQQHMQRVREQFLVSSRQHGPDSDGSKQHAHE